MDIKRLLIILFIAASSLPLRAQMNNPYVDDKIVHFGFSLGMNFMSYGVRESLDTINGEVYHARVSSMMPGFSVGFITDLRMTRHLNLRFTPTLHFGQRTLTYKTESGAEVKGSEGNGRYAEVLSLPLDVPLYLKWSSEREKNYRPYVIVGGGVSFDFGGQKERVIYQKNFDYFAAFGFGCDFYFRWFKFCPEIKYCLGFNNVLTDIDTRPQMSSMDEFYTRSLSRLRNQMITITFNFE